ncbi:Cleavage and polyadenylation specificity factor (CPSF) A subunit protein [Rhynchospora pubera]|uniref:Cleavage and polyadenylation specificity factor (CPSF) A subunit protein n=1 Tax=Rhynchospora pubera TaxID=906938 RepID=A0AAV8GEC7_9POAL|nr:Cleavage and polyadenylation specificity factor (CPSF) A subunit protein [Rhynchospora pubera]
MAIGEKGLAEATAASPAPTRSHYLAKCILRGSAVLHAVQGRFRFPSSIDVVFGKETSLELVEISEDGVLQTVFEQTVFGIIKDIAVLRWNDRYQQFVAQAQGRDLLVVLSDSGKLSILAFSFEMHRFFAVTHVEMSKPGNSRHELGRTIAIDPEGNFIAVSAYEDNFVIFPVAQTAGGSFLDDKSTYPPEHDESCCLRRMSEFNARGTIWSMCFISSSTNYLSAEGYYPILAAIVHRRGYPGNNLLLYGYNSKTSGIHFLSQYGEFRGLAHSIAAVPNFSGFAFLFRVGDVLLMDLRNPKSIQCIRRISLPFPSAVEDRNFVVDISKQPPAFNDQIESDEAACALLELKDSAHSTMEDDDPMNIDSGNVKEIQNLNFIYSWSWEPVMRTSSKLLFCLDTGELYVIVLNFDVEGIRISLSDCLYSGQPCKGLLWMKDVLILGLVEMGDGMVLKIENGAFVYKGSIQNIAPILDLAVADCHDEKQDQMFACCGMKPDGSLRVIRSGISVDKLLRTPPIYQGISGTWALKMKEADEYHSFLVLSFLEETRVLSVGLSFNDVSEAVGFQPNVCTLACGLVSDLSLVQIHSRGVRLCLPTTTAHIEGVPLCAPVCTFWTPPDQLSINVGAIGHNLVVVATSNPCFLCVLGLKYLSAYKYEIYEIQRVLLHYEVSCMSIPSNNVDLARGQSDDPNSSLLTKLNASKVVVIGTHKPSVEIFSLDAKDTFRVLAVGLITVNNALGCPISGCVPEDVRLVLSDRIYVLSGLRNGMLLRFEWTKLYFFSQPEPSSYFGNMEISMAKSETAILEMIALRRIGIMPVTLVPLSDSSNSDVIVLSDRTWLLHASRQSLAYTSISFQPASHVTAVCCADCPSGILFVSENSLHLVEMVHSKRLNVQKFPIEGNPRKVLYHNESKTLFMIRTGLSSPSCSSDICQVDPLSGSFLSNFKCEPGETAKCMQIVNVGTEQVLVVGTSRSPGPLIMPSGEAESTKGRLIILSLASAKSNYVASSLYQDIGSYISEELVVSGSSSSPIEEMSTGLLKSIAQINLPGAVLSVCPYLENYFLAAAGNMLSVFGFLHDNPHRPRKLAVTRTRFTITCLKTFYTRIAVGDCRDGILFYAYREDPKKLELEFADPAQRLVADCALMDCETAVVSDRRGSISILSCMKNLEAYESPEKNLNINCSFYMGETVMSIQKALFSYKLPVDDVVNGGNNTERFLESSYNSVVASTLLGSVYILIPLNREEHQLLAAVQDRLATHRLTAPVLGNDHKEFRERYSAAGVPTLLDGDLLVQFLELTSLQQEAVLMSTGGQSSKVSTSDVRPPRRPTPLSVNQVVQTLERIHYALT